MLRAFAFQTRSLISSAVSLAAFFLALNVAVTSAHAAKYAVPNTKAPIGGTFTRNIKGEPPTLHPIMSTDVYATNVQSFVMDSLATRDSQTFEYKPRMAEKWEASKDGKVYTWHLRKGLTFHDGKPVTAEDVKFSFDAIFEKAYGAAEKQVYLEGIEKVEVVDPLTVKFYLKNTYFLNFNSMADLTIIPKHAYGDVEKSKKMTRELIGSGPYKLDRFDRGQRIVLKRDPNWYGFNTPEWKGSNNFETVVLRFVKEDAVSLEMVKKGDLDLEPLTAEFYEKKAVGDPWGKTVFRVKTENDSPKGFGFIGWNFRKDIFQDRNVRLALAHLMNRDEMNKKFRYGYSIPAAGPTYIQSEFASSKIKAIPFDPKKAQELLTKAGWKDSNKDGVLDKEVNGKKVDFKFSLIHANKDVEKYWTLYREDLKKVGIDMEIKYLEWNSFLKMLDDGNFEAVALAWSGSADWDPKQIWHSASAVPGGSNFINYKNPEVDKLIDQARFEMDKKKRTNLLRKVYETIAEDAPYAFLFNEKYSFYAHSDKVEKPGDTFRYEVGDGYWWAKQK